jgi:hypothetical protein
MTLQGGAQRGIEPVVGWLVYLYILGSQRKKKKKKEKKKKPPIVSHWAVITAGGLPNPKPKLPSSRHSKSLPKRPPDS